MLVLYGLLDAAFTDGESVGKDIETEVDTEAGMDTETQSVDEETGGKQGEGSAQISREALPGSYSRSVGP